MFLNKNNVFSVIRHDWKYYSKSLNHRKTFIFRDLIFDMTTTLRYYTDKLFIWIFNIVFYNLGTNVSLRIFLRKILNFKTLSLYQLGVGNAWKWTWISPKNHYERWYIQIIRFMLMLFSQFKNLKRRFVSLSTK